MENPIYKIEGPWRGRLNIVPRPRGGDWLADEVSLWKQKGLDVVVSLLTKEEVFEFDLVEEERLCRASNILFIAYPVLDREVPDSVERMRALVHQLDEMLVSGRNVGIHCRQGIGRSSLLAACLLVSVGEDVEAAFRRIRVARGCSVPDTVEQQEWVRTFASMSASVRETQKPWNKK